MLHIDRNAWFSTFHENVLHLCQDAGFDEELKAVLRFDSDARIYRTSKGLYRFDCYMNKRGYRFGRDWSEDQYQALLTDQQEGPVEVYCDLSLGNTWYMFQDKFYETSIEFSFGWLGGTGYFSVEFHRAGEVLFDEAKELCLNGIRDSEDIAVKICRFRCQLGEKEVKSEVFCTEEQYQALLVKQHEEPVKVMMRLFDFPYESGISWWMFQDKVYWTSEDLTQDEAGQWFFEGKVSHDGIVWETFYSFKCSLGGKRELESDEFWTEEEHQVLLAKQREAPVQMLSDRESGKKWWMFRDRFYWEDDNLQEIEVKALLLERDRMKKRRIERAIRQMEEDE